jgi:lipoprotein-anchoring transpeptidase ErfK/SrfK
MLTTTHRALWKAAHRETGTETMKTFTKIAAALTIMLGLASPSEAGFFQFKNLKPLVTGAPSVTATISIAEQRMTLRVVNKAGVAQTYVWKVSTGKSGFATPTGAYKPTWLSADHYSKTYDAPMPYAVFFKGGYAIHATAAVGRLGSRASHGCIRLASGNAAMFFDLVETYGRSNTKIVITR